MPEIGLHVKAPPSQALSRRKSEIYSFIYTHKLLHSGRLISCSTLPVQGIIQYPCFGSRMYLIRTINYFRPAHWGKRRSGRPPQILLINGQHVVLQSDNLDRLLRMES